jgi:hypothetical protein
MSSRKKLFCDLEIRVSIQKETEWSNDKTLLKNLHLKEKSIRLRNKFEK